MSNAYKSVLASGGGGGEITLDSLVITTPASKDVFIEGDTVDITGLVVTGTAGHMSGDVTQDCTISPTVFTQIGETTVTLSYGGLSTSYQVNVIDGLSIPFGFYVDGSKPTDNVSYQVQYNGDNVLNYNYSPAYMDFANDTWVWGDWNQNLFFMPRPVLIKQDYSEKIYLNPDDLTEDINGNDVTDKLTGVVNGYNAMMEWGRGNGKRIWYKIVSTGTSYTVYIAAYQLDQDFHAWSFYDQDDVITDYFYTAIYNGSNVSGELRSLSGKTPSNNETGTNQIAEAKLNNKNNEDYAWYVDTYADRILINFLTTMLIKSTNSDVIGYGNCTGGSSASSLLQTGSGNDKGMFYGQQANSVVKVFGMENWFGNAWRLLVGFGHLVGWQYYKMTYGVADGSSSPGYKEIQADPDNYIYANVSVGTYQYGADYIQYMTAIADGAIVINSPNWKASATTYYCDYVLSNSGICYAIVGGACNSDHGAGMFATNFNHGFADASWGITACLSLKPRKATLISA